MNHKDLGNGGNDNDDDDDDVLPVRTAHANEAIKVPSGSKPSKSKN